MNMNPFNQAPIPYNQASKQFATNVLNVVDATDSYLYDRLAYPAAGALNFTFFTVPIGGAKTIQDTNLTLSGQLGAGEGFLVKAVCVELALNTGDIQFATDPDRYLREWMSVMQGRCSLTVRIGAQNIKVQDAPLLKFPLMQYVDASIGFGTTLNATSEGATFLAHKGRPYIPTPFELVSGQSFSASIDFAAVVAISNAATIGVHLWGQKFRNAQ